eukprot:2955625-Pyramimonas_sp.AAC.1
MLRAICSAMRIRPEAEIVSGRAAYVHGRVIQMNDVVCYTGDNDGRFVLGPSAAPLESGRRTCVVHLALE